MARRPLVAWPLARAVLSNVAARPSETEQVPPRVQKLLQLSKQVEALDLPEAEPTPAMQFLLVGGQLGSPPRLKKKRVKKAPKVTQDSAQAMQDAARPVLPPLALDRIRPAAPQPSTGTAAAAPSALLFNANDVLPDGTAPPTVRVPAWLAAKLKPHQWEGVRFMWDNMVLARARGEQPGCVLAHSMGLGKTLQALTFLHCLHSEEPGLRTLLLVPANVLANWADEFQCWLPSGGPGLTRSHVSAFGLAKQKTDTPAARRATIQAWAASTGVGSVLLCTPTLFVNLVAPAVPELRKGTPTAEDVALATLLLDQTDVVCVDEAHEMRAKDGKRKRACGALRTQRRLALTGSPLQNNLSEFWAMMDFVRPGDMETEKEFARKFTTPIQAGLAPGATKAEVRVMCKRLGVLHMTMESYVNRKGPELLDQWLPRKTELRVTLQLSPLQHALACALHEHTAGAGGLAIEACSRSIADRPADLRAKCLMVEDQLARGAAAAAAAAAAAGAELLAASQPEEAQDEEAADPEGAAEVGPSTSGRSLSSEFYLECLRRIRAAGLADDAPLPSAKQEYLAAAARWCADHGQHILLFSQFTKTLDVCQSALADRLGWVAGRDWLRLDGATKATKRQELIEQFNAAASKGTPPHLFMLSTKAGGVGINLTGATRVILLDPTWNPTYLTQAAARVHRFGQEQPTFIHHLVVGGSVEGRVYAVAGAKAQLSDRVVDRNHAAVASGGTAHVHREPPPAPPAPPDESALAAAAAAAADPMLCAILAQDGPSAGGHGWVAAVVGHAEELRRSRALELSAADQREAAAEFLAAEAAEVAGSAAQLGGPGLLKPLTARGARLQNRIARMARPESAPVGGAGEGAQALQKLHTTADPPDTVQPNSPAGRKRQLSGALASPPKRARASRGDQRDDDGVPLRPVVPQQLAVGGHDCVDLTGDSD